MLGYASAVVVPNSTKPAMIEKLRVAGASAVVQHGATWSEADAHLREDVIARDAGGVYVPPFDHPAVWAGAATMVPELEAQVGPAGALAGVVCSVGGGGLLCGIVQGLDASRFAGARVLAVETAGAASLHAAVQAGELVTLPGITSIATSLGATRVAQRAFEYGMRADVHCIVVSDAEAVDACWRFADEERMLVEPACGAALAVVYSGKLKDAMPELRPEDQLVIVVCGGVNVSVEALVEYRRMFETAP
jgi:L-serine/L-threonine ammonia-lyase